jgi:hypothetical protein
MGDNNIEHLLKAKGPEGEETLTGRVFSGDLSDGRLPQLDLSRANKVLDGSPLQINGLLLAQADTSRGPATTTARSNSAVRDLLGEDYAGEKLTYGSQSANTPPPVMDNRTPIPANAGRPVQPVETARPQQPKPQLTAEQLRDERRKQLAKNYTVNDVDEAKAAHKKAQDLKVPMVVCIAKFDGDDEDRPRLFRNPQQKKQDADSKFMTEKVLPQVEDAQWGNAVFVHCSPKEANVVARALGVKTTNKGALPHTVVTDASGNTVLDRRGRISAQELVQKIHGQ